MADEEEDAPVSGGKGLCAFPFLLDGTLWVISQMWGEGREGEGKGSPRPERWRPSLLRYARLVWRRRGRSWRRLGRWTRQEEETVLQRMWVETGQKAQRRADGSLAGNLLQHWFKDDVLPSDTAETLRRQLWSYKFVFLKKPATSILCPGWKCAKLLCRPHKNIANSFSEPKCAGSQSHCQYLVG